MSDPATVQEIIGRYAAFGVKAAPNGGSARDYHAEFVAAFLSEESIERVAAALDRNFNPDEYPVMGAMFIDYAEIAIRALIGEGS